jgi:CheY-like chemotaxis protein
VPSSLVLVVDDDAAIRHALADALEQEGYRVSAAKDGVEALAALAHERPAVIILDLLMPEMDGWHFLSARLRDPDVIEVPVILTSARTDEMRAARRIGATYVVPKPFELDALLDLLARLCG